MAQEASPSFQKTEAQVKAITAAKHMKEIKLVEKLINHYLAGFRALGKFTLNEDNELEYAWLLLTTRSFNSLRCAYDLLLKGYYSQAVMLICSVFEDWLIAKDCEKNQKTLDALLRGDDVFWKQEFHYSEMAKRQSEKFPEIWRGIYGTLSTIAHARQRALMILVDPETRELRLGSHYDNDLFLATYQSLLTAASIIPELLYKLLGDHATQWWTETLPTLQVAKAEIERIGKEFKNNNET